MVDIGAYYNTNQMHEHETVLEINSLTKKFGNVTAVRNISFEIKKQEIFGFVGPNGAGKSTTINCLVDCLRPTTGKINIFGMDSKKDAVEIHRRIGFFSGTMDLYNNLTVNQYFNYMRSLQGKGSKSYTQQLSKRLQINTNRKIRQLSRGNSIKVGLVAALMHKPELLILDEPTTGLDPLIQQQFYKLLKQHQKSGGTTFISSHILPEVELLCDRVGFINNGHLLEVATLESLRVKSIREVYITFAEAVKPSYFNSIKGVKQVKVDRQFATIHVEGSLDPLIKKIAKQTVINIVSRDLDLDEVFLKFYGKKRK